MVKVKLGTLIEPIRVVIDPKFEGVVIKEIVGLSTSKEIIKTKAKIDDGINYSMYKMFPKNSFAYVPDTSRRGEKISLAYNNHSKHYLVSPISQVFEVKDNVGLLPDFLFMYFNRPEFDRYSRFNSWGSARETFSWNDMCDIDIDLPSIIEQEKAVAVYNALRENQSSYERGLDDLKLTCDAYIEELRSNMPCEEIGKYIEPVITNNADKTVKNVMGVESSSQFMKTKAKMGGIDTSKYTVVKTDNFAYNPSRINLGSIALFKGDACVVSPMYVVFKVKDEEKLISEYLMIWLSRSEFHRATWFYAAGSVRDTFDYSLMKEVKIPIPKKEVQQSIVNIYNVYITRREINELLKKQLKEICSVLIKGAVAA